MNKLFSKVATLSVGLAMAIGVGVAVGSKEAKVVKADSVAEFTLSSASDVEVDGVTASFATGSGSSAPAWYDNGLRLYVSNTITISSESTITGVTFNWEKQGSKTFNTVTANVGNYTHPSSAGEGTWSGEANEIVFTCGTTSKAQLQLNTFNVTYSGGSTDVLESITVTGSMSKTAYYVGESWSPTGLVATGHYQTAGNKDISDKVTWTYSPASPALNVTSVVATASIGDISGSSSAQAVTVSKANPIQAIYQMEELSDFDVRGIYVGFLDGTGPVIMDGAYGIVAFARNHDVSTYEQGVTVLHITGKMTIFNGLYELGGSKKEGSSTVYYNPTISVETDSAKIAEVEAPVVYASKGGETQEYESRLTTVTGVPSLYPDGTKYGDFSEDAGTKDIRMKFAVGTKEIVVFYKKAAQTADAEAYSAMKAAVTNSDEITIKGFTGWYNGFQVQMNGYIPPVEDYTAEEFAQDLLDQTDNACSAYPGSDNDPSYNFSAYKTALEAIWSDLAGDDKYPSLPKDQKDILADASREGTSTISRAMKRYDFLTGKYDLSNFIVGRTPIVPPSGRYGVSDLTADNNTMIIVISIAATSALAFTMLLVFKKKKQK